METKINHSAVTILFACLLMFNTQSKAQLLLGGEVGYFSANSTGYGGGIIGGYTINKKIILDGGIGYISVPNYERNGNSISSTDLFINANINFAIVRSFIGKGFCLYGLAGAGFNSWNNKQSVSGSSAVPTSSVASGFGINIGLGAEYGVTSHLRIFLEPKYLISLAPSKETILYDNLGNEIGTARIGGSPSYIGVNIGIRYTFGSENQ